MANEKENVNPDSKIEDLPDPKIAEPQAGQALAQAGDPPVTLESLRDMVREEMQSVKDTRIGKSETRLDHLESAIAQYEAEKGGTVDVKALSKLQGVQREQDLLARIEVLEGGKVPEASAGAGTKSWKERQASILSKAEIDANDPRVIEMLRKEDFDSHDAYVEALEKKADEWSFADAKKPKPSPSTVAQTIPSIVPSPGAFDDYTSDQLGDKLIELSKTPSKNRAEMDTLDAELARRDAKKQG